MSPEGLFQAFRQLEDGHSVALAGNGNTRAIHGGETPLRDRGPCIGLKSSGSNGRPHLVWWPWNDLLATATHPHSQARRNWASAFRLDTFAGVHVALCAWRSGARFFALGQSWRHDVALIQSGQLDVLAATPTYFRLLRTTMRHAPRHPPRWVTAGGELIGGNLECSIARMFPGARVRNIYATSELGPLLRSPRLDGWFDLPGSDGGDFRLQNGHLEVSRDGGWRDTGDLAEIRGGRLRVTGRSGRVATVAGTVISLAAVENAATGVRGVISLEAVPEPNPVAGQIVHLKFIAAHSEDPATVRRRIESRIRGELPREAWPRRWTVCGLRLGPNSKRLLEPHRKVEGRP